MGARKGMAARGDSIFGTALYAYFKVMADVGSAGNALLPAPPPLDVSLERAVEVFDRRHAVHEVRRKARDDSVDVAPQVLALRGEEAILRLQVQHLLAEGEHFRELRLEVLDHVVDGQTFLAQLVRMVPEKGEDFADELEMSLMVEPFRRHRFIGHWS